MVDVKKALLNPSAVFKRPEEVVESNELSRNQKIEILGRWEYDVRQLQVADEESMTAPRPEPVTLDAVLKALRALGAPADVEHSAPTKQGGS
ncbi:MAG: hypothetical protein ACREP3_05535 [Candidatus Binatia bacterium]